MMITETTILNPKETHLRIDVFLCDTENLTEPNGYGEYKFSFQPVSYGDYQLLMEAAESALMKVETSLSPYSTKRPAGCYENKYGQPFCSQLFKPIVEPELEDWELLHKQASLSLHFRDAVDGKVYLQADYVDVYDPTNGIDEETDHTLHPNYDPLDDEF
jgi:hypothetical protein